MKVNLITYDAPDQRITAKADSLSFDAALNLLLKRTNITYRKEDGIYFIGDKNTNGIASTRLYCVSIISVPTLPVELIIPELIKQNATIQVVKEHNGLMVTGTNDVIVELDHVVQEIDYPTPQILIEALVVDFEASDLFELGLALGPR